MSNGFQVNSSCGYYVMEIQMSLFGGQDLVGNAMPTLSLKGFMGQLPGQQERKMKLMHPFLSIICLGLSG